MKKNNPIWCLSFCSVVVTNGVNVDWLGWCVDDDEVMNQLQPGGEGQSLLFWYLPDLSEQEEGECSQVWRCTMYLL